MNYKTILNSLILLFSFLSGTISATAQESKVLKPKRYKYDNKRLVFEDNFDDDRNGWILNRKNTPTEKAKYYDGRLYLESTDTVISSCELVFPVNQDKDFEIEIGVQILFAKDKKQDAIYLLWNADTAATTKDIIQIAKNGRFNFAHCLGNDHKKCIHDYGCGYFLFKKDEYNIITIRKVSEKYYIFMNHQLSAKADFYLSKGNTIVLGAGEKTMVAYNYIHVSYLE